MRKASMRLGYRTVTCSGDCTIGEQGLTARGHEFHYSTLVSTGSLSYACELHDAQGQLVGQDGLVTRNVLALYAHVHFSSTPKIAERLLATARRFTPRSHGEAGIIQ
jgi:cobyrinic acid a,c-diamide synthase